MILIATVGAVLGACTRPNNPPSAAEHFQVAMKWQQIVVDEEAGVTLFIRPLEGERSELLLRGAPPNVLTLKMAPRERESELNDGKWLVMAVAPVSGPDLACIPLAVKALRASRSNIKVGIRPFSAYDEIRSWVPGYDRNMESPFWVLLENGKVVGLRNGRLSEEDIRKMIDDLK